MPFPNEHAARIKVPGQFDRVRRKNNAFGQGIHAIYGVKDGRSEVQAVRFDKNRYTVAQARKWLKDHNYAVLVFEEASMSEHYVCDVSPRAVEAEEFTGKEWDVTIIGASSENDIVQSEGRSLLRSKNGRFYDLEALRNSVSLWEGVKVYDNHLTDEEFQQRAGMRSVAREWIGSLSNPQWQENKLTAVLKVVEESVSRKLKSAWDAGILNTIGLSIDTITQSNDNVTIEGQRYPIIEGFQKILSVDLVAEPAAGGSFNRVLAADTSADYHMRDGEEVSMTPEEIKQLVTQAIAESLPQAIAEAMPTAREADEEPAEDQEAGEVEDQEGGESVEERLERIEQQQALAECERVLTTRLATARLSENTSAVVRDLFGQRVFDAGELDKVIARLKEAEAASDPTGQVSGLGGQRSPQMQQITINEKAEAEFVRIMWGNTEFRGLEHIEDDVVKERMPEGYKAWLKDGRPNSGYGVVSPSEWLRIFYGDPFTGAPARSAEAVTTSTMSSIVKNAVNVMIANDYAKRDRWWEPIVRPEEVDSINQATLVRIYGLDTLDVVNEGAAYTELAWADEEETPTFVKKGNFVGVTLEAMLRDKVQAIRALPTRLSSTWFNTISSLVAAVFTTNTAAGPVLGDTGALFNATAVSTAGGHANLLTTALSLSAYGSARTAMRKQTDQTLGNGRKLQINPAYLLVPEDLETTALQVRNSELIPGSSNNDVNPWFQKFEVVVVPDWTDANDWALVANPTEYPAIWTIFLTGNRVPSIYTADSESGGAMFTNDMLRYKVRMLTWRFSATYDCSPVSDFRPLHKNNVS